MTKKELCKIFTDKVTEYIENEYVITPNSFSGSDGTSRVDLVKDDSFIRIYMDEEPDFDSNVDKIYIRVAERKLIGKEKKNIYNMDIVWTKELTTIYELSFITIGKYRHPYYVTEEEYAELKDKIAERTKRRYEKYASAVRNIYTFPDSAKAKVLSFIQSKPKCKSVKLKDIEKVEKHVYDDFVTYKVYCRGKTYALN